MKKTLQVIGVVLILILLVCGTVVAYLTIDEYKPADVEQITIQGEATAKGGVPMGQSMRIMTWNLGYGALGDNADFFMDGGKMVTSSTKERVYQNLDDDIEVIKSISPDFLFVQEIDLNSTRSHFVNESDYLTENSESDVLCGQKAFAYNYKVSFVPLPIPPIGRVHCGLTTFSKYNMDSVQRISLPCPFTWPLRIMNLKRCLEVSRIPVEGTDKELVLVNLHLEAYDDGDGKIAQTNQLKNFLLEEVEKGNYVIAGGDFNQVFSNTDASSFPVLDGMWTPGVVNVEEFGSDLTFLADSSVPSCRSLDRVLKDADSTDPKDFQYYIIDGFIVSGNIDVENLETRELGFVSSDHNPVVLDFVLK
jgi:endonuclease/exonuclease/phosphatase family metal-dependent hydrolase